VNSARLSAHWCWLRAKQATTAVGVPRPIWRQLGAGLGSDRTRRSAGRLVGRKSP